VAKQKCEEGTFRREELPGRFTAKNYSDGQTRDTTKNTGEISQKVTYLFCDELGYSFKRA